jgi:hypothetical protein
MKPPVGFLFCACVRCPYQRVNSVVIFAFRVGVSGQQVFMGLKQGSDAGFYCGSNLLLGVKVFGPGFHLL